MGEDRLITSLTNDTVKAVRALHMRKQRDATGTFLAEGLKFIGEALDQGHAPRLLLVGQDARPHPLLDRARAETAKAGGAPAPIVRASSRWSVSGVTSIGMKPEGVAIGSTSSARRQASNCERAIPCRRAVAEI